MAALVVARRPVPKSTFRRSWLTSVEGQMGPCPTPRPWEAGFISWKDGWARTKIFTTYAASAVPWWNPWKVITWDGPDVSALVQLSGSAVRKAGRGR